MMTCSICVESALTVISPSASAVLSWISSLMSLASNFSMPLMRELRSRGWEIITCFLLKARSPWVRCDAFSERVITCSE